MDEWQASYSPRDETFEVTLSHRSIVSRLVESALDRLCAATGHRFEGLLMYSRLATWAQNTAPERLISIPISREQAIQIDASWVESIESDDPEF